MDGIDGGERLHKLMARCGVASKRKCEELIRDGRITVDGVVVVEMGVKVDPARQDVRFDGERLKPQAYVYYLAYKPRRTLSTTEDRFGRRTVVDLVRDARGLRLFQVGRLDQHAEGLVLLTNDGGFAQVVSHPRRRLDRTFFLKVRGTVAPETAAKAREGVWLSDGRTAPMEVQLVKAGKDVSTVKCRVVESQHHRLSRVWAKLGHPVQRMILVRIGTIGTEGLSKGASRKLTSREVALLRDGAPAEILPPASRRFGRAPEDDGDVVAWGGKAEARDEALLEADEAPPRRPAPRGGRKGAAGARSAGRAGGKPPSRPAKGARAGGPPRRGRARRR